MEPVTELAVNMCLQVSNAGNHNPVPAKARLSFEIKRNGCDRYCTVVHTFELVGQSKRIVGAEMYEPSKSLPFPKIGPIGHIHGADQVLRRNAFAQMGA